MVRNKIHLPRSLARAAVVMIMAGMIASTGVAAAEPNNGPVVVGETFQIWPVTRSWRRATAGRLRKTTTRRSTSLTTTGSWTR